MEIRDVTKKIRHVFQTTPLANNQPLQTLGASSAVTDFFTAQTLDGFFNGFFKIAIIVGAMLAVMRLGYAGFIYMTTDSFGQLGSAKQIIQDAVIGLLLLLSIWLILYQINPNLLNLNILQGVQSTPGGQPLPGSQPIGQPVFGPR